MKALPIKVCGLCGPCSVDGRWLAWKFSSPLWKPRSGETGTVSFFHERRKWWDTELEGRRHPSTAGLARLGLGVPTHFSFCSESPGSVSEHVHPLDRAHAVVPVGDLVCRELKHDLGELALDPHLLQVDGHVWLHGHRYVLGTARVEVAHLGKSLALVFWGIQSWGLLMPDGGTLGAGSKVSAKTKCIIQARICRPS